jgi:hypothetical protein
LHQPDAKNAISASILLKFVSRFDDFEREFGAGDEIRTHDPNLGKVVLYP